MDIILLLAKGHCMEVYQAIIGVLLTLLGIAIGMVWSHTSTGKEVTINSNKISGHESDIKTLFRTTTRNTDSNTRCLELHQEMLGVTRELISQNTILIHQKTGDG